MHTLSIGRLGLASVVLLAGAALGTAQNTQQYQRVTTAPKKTGMAAWGESFTSGMKRMGSALTPKTPVKSAPDATSLSSKTKPGPELYLAVALSHEQSGNLPAAEAQYERLLRAWPDHAEGALAYAQFLDRQDRLGEAITLYERAGRRHPKEPAIPNALGLCYAEHNMFPEAAAALEKAVALAPKQAIFRNNLATVLVQMGRTDEAFAQLREVHDEATTYYNLGYLLQKRGQRAEATGYFSAALACNPSLKEAQVWLDHLRAEESQPQAAMVADRRAAAQGNAAERSSAGRPDPGVQVMQPPRRTQPALAAPVEQATRPAQPVLTGPMEQATRPGQPIVWPEPRATSEAVARPAMNPPLPQSQPPVAPTAVGTWPPSLPAEPSRPLPSREVQPAGVNLQWQPEPTRQAAPLPAPSNPTGTPTYGTPNTQVVYPLPPVEDEPAIRR